MACEVKPTGATLGAFVTGARLDALGEADFRILEAAFLEHALLIFPGQHPSHDGQVAFGLRFGPLDPLVAATGRVAISNQRADGSLRDDDDPVKQILLGNEGWHTDSSYMPVAAKASLLAAEVVTEEGGETEWADMRAAYEALDPAMRERIADLAARHSLKYSQARAGYGAEPGVYRYGLDQDEAPLRPLVKVHPETGRPALFIGRHAYGIRGLAPEESEALLDELLDSACLPPRVWSHRWAPGDLAIWDNRCVLHRARPYDPGLPRVMHHTRIAGDPASESGLSAGPPSAGPPGRRARRPGAGRLRRRSELPHRKPADRAEDGDVEYGREPGQGPVPPHGDSHENRRRGNRQRRSGHGTRPATHTQGQRGQEDREDEGSDHVRLAAVALEEEDANEEDGGDPEGCGEGHSDRSYRELG